ncbi:MAG: polysaccharide deacetylase family protein [Bacteroidales bacterium]|nr:polysaccharide deacetylase family protein [Bacteroidales bacterium]
MNNLLFSFAQLLPYSILTSTKHKKIIFPFYHTVTDSFPSHLIHLYPIKKRKDFLKDLEFFLKYYTPISVDDFIEKRIKRNSVLLTFDDGLVEIFDVIAPILKQKGIPAVFFVNSAFVDNKNLFYRYKVSIIIDEILKDLEKNELIEAFLKKLNVFNGNTLDSLLEINFLNCHILDEVYQLIGGSFYKYLQQNPVYLSSEQISKLKNQGFCIGAHSVNHPRFKNISFENQLKQTLDSVKFVHDNFNPRYNLFAFPFSDDGVSKLFFEKLFSASDIRYTFGTAGIKNDVVHKNIQRIPMENGKSAKQTLKYQYFANLLKSLLNKNTIYR